jgi:hypothetical protein
VSPIRSNGTWLVANIFAGVSREDAMRMRVILPTVGLLTMLLGGHALAGPVVVACGPGQHAIVRDTFVRGEPVTRVSCVEREFSATTYREPYSTRYRLVRRHRSWGKSALIIGGLTATGAGLGGIVGGRRGTLIGAAIGGGAGSLYEGAHRR